MWCLPSASVQPTAVVRRPGATEAHRISLQAWESSQHWRLSGPETSEPHTVTCCWFDIHLYYMLYKIGLRKTNLQRCGDLHCFACIVPRYRASRDIWASPEDRLNLPKTAWDETASPLMSLYSIIFATPSIPIYTHLCNSLPSRSYGPKLKNKVPLKQRETRSTWWR